MKFYLLLIVFFFKGIGALSAQPIGSVIAYAGDISVLEKDSTYLHCDGRLLKISEYPKLFKAIGWAYLNRNDSISKEYFRLPNYQGYFLRGVDQSGKIDKDPSARVSSSGSRVGPLVGTIQDEELVSHSHGITDPGHNHGMRDDNLSGGRKNFSGAEITMYSAGQSPKPNGVTGITINSFGGKETRPVNFSVYWIIKVK